MNLHTSTNRAPKYSPSEKRLLRQFSTSESVGQGGSEKQDTTKLNYLGPNIASFEQVVHNVDDINRNVSRQMNKDYLKALEDAQDY